MATLQGFIGPAYQDRSLDLDCQRCINLYYEPVGAESASPKAKAGLIGTPGRRLLVKLPDGPTRGQLTGGNRLFVVSGSTLYEVFLDPIANPPFKFGTLNINSSPAQILENGRDLFVVTGGQGYVVEGTSAPQAVVQAATACFIDTYYVVSLPNSRNFQISAINDGSSWDPLDFGVKEGNPDNIARVFAHNDQLWLLGFETIEVWQNTGAANFPFQKISGTFIPTGCIAPYSVCEVQMPGGIGLMWLGGGQNGHGVIWLVPNGYVPQRVSTYALEDVIQNQYELMTDAEAYSYQDGGHSFYVIRFPSSDAEWVYDLTASQQAGIPIWHERLAWSSATAQWHIDIARNHSFAFDRHIVGDYRDGSLYVQSLNYFDDAGVNIRRLRTAPHLSSENKRIANYRLELDLQKGTVPVTGPGSNPMMMLRYSDDGGRTWSNEKWRSVGRTGEYSHRVVWRQLGTARDRVNEMSSIEPIQHAWVGLYTDAVQGDG